MVGKYAMGSVAIWLKEPKHARMDSSSFACLHGISLIDRPPLCQMPIWDHLEELRERVLVCGLVGALSILGCFCFSKELIIFLELPVADAGVRFLQLSPGEFFFTTLKV